MNCGIHRASIAYCCRKRCPYARLHSPRLRVVTADGVSPPRMAGTYLPEEQRPRTTSRGFSRDVSGDAHACLNPVGALDQAGRRAFLSPAVNLAEPAGVDLTEF